MLCRVTFRLLSLVIGKEENARSPPLTGWQDRYRSRVPRRQQAEVRQNMAQKKHYAAVPPFSVLNGVDLVQCCRIRTSFLMAAFAAVHAPVWQAGMFSVRSAERCASAVPVYDQLQQMEQARFGLRMAEPRSKVACCLFASARRRPQETMYHCRGAGRKCSKDLRDKVTGQIAAARQSRPAARSATEVARQRTRQRRQPQRCIVFAREWRKEGEKQRFSPQGRQQIRNERRSDQAPAEDLSARTRRLSR